MLHFGALEETYEDVLGVLALDSSDDSGSNVELLPGLGQVEVVDTILGALVDVAFHVGGNVLGADVDLKTKRLAAFQVLDSLPQRRSSQQDLGLCSWCTKVPSYVEKVLDLFK